MRATVATLPAYARNARWALRACAGALAFLVGPAELTAQQTRNTRTAAAITQQDLRTRLHAFAHDSMEGRAAGTPGHTRAARYLAAELQRLGLEPAGEHGTFLQTVPLVARRIDPATALRLGTRQLRLGVDFVVPDTRRPLRSLPETQLVFGGFLEDSSTWISTEAARGRFLLFTRRSAAGGPLSAQFVLPGGRYVSAAGLAFARVGPAYEGIRQAMVKEAIGTRPGAENPAHAPIILLSGALSEELLASGLETGATIAPITGTIRFRQTAAPTYNVAGILRGSDPRLRNSYVAIGAHSDHVGIGATVADHDSLRAFNTVLRPSGVETGPRQATDADRERITAIMDSLRRHRPQPRRDSIFNGADDDGSGSVALLEIAEALVAARVRPKRSILFVWHTAEELGMLGSEWFTEYPPVPLDSIVAQINVDMIGRGSADDLPAGGPAFLQLVGSRRLSRQFGDMVEQVNRERPAPYTFDYTYDADGHPANIYCRSDHASYARFGIPVAFFTTGIHRDYHMLTDEPQYIDYPKLESVTRFLHDLTVYTANLAERPRLDAPPPDPTQPCRQ